MTELTREQKEALGRMIVEGFRKGDPDIVAGCLKRGADPDVSIKDSDDGLRKPVIHWAMKNFNEKAAQALVAGGANVDARDASGETALFSSIRDFNVAAVQFLMRNGADPLAQAAGNTVALDVARDLRTDHQYYTDRRDQIIKAMTSDYGLPRVRAKTPAEPAPETPQDIQVLKPISLQQPKKPGGLGFNL